MHRILTDVQSCLGWKRQQMNDKVTVEKLQKPSSRSIIAHTSLLWENYGKEQIRNNFLRYKNEWHQG